MDLLFREEENATISDFFVATDLPILDKFMNGKCLINYQSFKNDL